MHVLHRPLLPKALTITVLAAALAIVLTLAIVSGLNDHAFSAGTPLSPPALARTSASGPGAPASPFTRSPFSRLLTAPVTPPWAKQGPPS